MYTDCKDIISIPKDIVRQKSEYFEMEVDIIKQFDSLSAVLFLIYMSETIKLCKKRTNRATVEYWRLIDTDTDEWYLSHVSSLSHQGTTKTPVLFPRCVDL